MKNKLITVYKFILFFLFICSMYPWFVWDRPTFFLNLLGAFISLLLLLFDKKQFEINKFKIFPCFLLTFTLIWISIHLNINGVIEQCFIFITLFLLISTKDELKIEIFEFLTKGMAILIAFSLFFYALFLLGVPLPHYTLQESTKGYGGLNYYGFITYDDIRKYFRFRSIFAEPGHLSLGLVPLLYANKLNLKRKSVLILFIGELFTLSLAGYVVLFISVVVYSFSRSKSSRYHRWALLLLVFFGVFLSNKLSENNVINQAIITRLAFNESTGTIEGNNRTKSYTDEAYETFIKSSDFLYGMDNKKFIEVTLGSAGYKVYMMAYGLIGVLLVVFMYFSFVGFYYKYEVLGFFLILMLSLYQNGYPFRYAVILGYILGVSMLFYKDEFLVQKK